MQLGNESTSVFGIHLTLKLQDRSNKSWQRYFTMDGYCLFFSLFYFCDIDNIDNTSFANSSQLLSQVQIGLPVAFKIKQIPDPICHGENNCNFIMHLSRCLFTKTNNKGWRFQLGGQYGAFLAI